MLNSKTLILIRHAHRDTEERTRDNGLSEKGKEQVKQLVKFAMKRLEGSEPTFFTSPLKRCVETITPLAKEWKQEVILESRLAEHKMAESHEQYMARIDEFLDFWRHECPHVTVVCSHGDWIPFAIEKLTGAKVGIKKSGWCEIEHSVGESSIAWLIQKHY